MLRLNLLQRRPSRRFWALLSILGMCVPALAGAEYYRYETENGSIAFTDDPAQIPARYRDSAEALPEQSLHDFRRTTRVEPRPKAEAAPDVSAPPPATRRIYIQPRAATPRRVTISAGEGVDFDVETDSPEPIIVQKGVLRSDGRGTAEYTIVKQGDKVLMEVREPIVNWVEP
jgi:hypothetical protein